MPRILLITYGYIHHENNWSTLWAGIQPRPHLWYILRLFVLIWFGLHILIYTGFDVIDKKIDKTPQKIKNNWFYLQRRHVVAVGKKIKIQKTFRSWWALVHQGLSFSKKKMDLNLFLYSHPCEILYSFNIRELWSDGFSFRNWGTTLTSIHFFPHVAITIHVYELTWMPIIAQLFSTWFN